MEADFIEGRRHLVGRHPGHWNAYEPETPIKPSAYMSFPLLHKKLVNVAAMVRREKKIVANENEVMSTLKALSLAELMDNLALRAPDWYVKHAKISIRDGIYY